MLRISACGMKNLLSCKIWILLTSSLSISIMLMRILYAVGEHAVRWDLYARGLVIRELPQCYYDFGAFNHAKLY